MSSETPFMPLWVSDFLGDTLDLDAKEVGAYMLLLMAMWQRDGTLPDDPQKLRRVARCGRDWPKVWGSIQHFFTTRDGVIHNKRLTKELEKVNHKRAVNAENGSRGGRAKALKSKGAVVANTKGSQKPPSPPAFANELSEAIAIYNEIAERVGWPQAQKATASRSSSIKARLKDCGGIEGWRSAMQRAADSDFLTGRSEREWNGFSLDWIRREANFTKLMEGNYDNRQAARTGNERNGGSSHSSRMRRIIEAASRGSTG